jgi:hypothetical protein
MFAVNAILSREPSHQVFHAALWLVQLGMLLQYRSIRKERHVRMLQWQSLPSFVFLGYIVIFATSWLQAAVFGGIVGSYAVFLSLEVGGYVHLKHDVFEVRSHWRRRAKLKYHDIVRAYEVAPQFLRVGALLKSVATVCLELRSSAPSPAFPLVGLLARRKVYLTLSSRSAQELLSQLSSRGVAVA